MDKIVILMELTLGVLIFLWHPFLLMGILLGAIGTYLWIRYPEKFAILNRSSTH